MMAKPMKTLEFQLSNDLVFNNLNYCELEVDVTVINHWPWQISIKAGILNACKCFLEMLFLIVLSIYIYRCFQMWKFYNIFHL